jgi:Kef-type K+ transport system membrane component KefB
VTETLYTVAALLAIVGGVAWIAARLRLPPPILLVLAGMALAFMPWLPTIVLDA